MSIESSTRCSTSISRSVSQTLILDLHVLTSSHRGGAHNAGPQMMCAATFHASYNYSVFSLSAYVVHIIILFHASLQRLFKPNIIIIGYVCVDHNIIIIILGTFRLRPEYSVILVPFLRVVHISPTMYKLFQ